MLNCIVSVYHHSPAKNHFLYPYIWRFNLVTLHQADIMDIFFCITLRTTINIYKFKFNLVTRVYFICQQHLHPHHIPCHFLLLSPHSSAPSRRPCWMIIYSTLIRYFLLRDRLIDSCDFTKTTLPVVRQRQLETIIPPTGRIF